MDIINRYNQVINDGDFLSSVVSNARNWYIRNISSENITNKIVESLGL
jgi:hypothetical protein